MGSIPPAFMVSDIILLSSINKTRAPDAVQNSSSASVVIGSGVFDYSTDSSVEGKWAPGVDV